LFSAQPVLSAVPFVDFALVWAERSTRSVTDVSERGSAITKTVPTIVPVARQNCASRADANQID